MKKINIIYWISSIVLAGLILMSAIPNILSTPEWKEIFKQLGYPQYLLPFLGVAKLLAVIAILVPCNARLKEWAYAGLVFDLSGVVYSALAMGTPVMKILPFFLLLFVLIAISYIYHHKKLKATEQQKQAAKTNSTLGVQF